MSIALTEAEQARGERRWARERDGRRPGIDPFDEGWFKFPRTAQSTPGLDGASYTSATDENGSRNYVEITSNGFFEFVRTAQDPAEWIRDRRSQAAQALVPLSAIGGDSRSDREDAVLAFLVQRPAELREVNWLPVATFTTNRRFEIYDAMVSLQLRGKEITPEAMLSVMATRLEDMLPRQTWMRRYDLHDSSVYIGRLMVTPSDAITAMEAAEELCAADLRAVLEHRQGRPSTVKPPLADLAPEDALRALECKTQLLPLHAPTLLDASTTPQVRP